MIDWIDDPRRLAEALAASPDVVGLDTEFVRERTYWPQLALVQCALGERIVLVDPLVTGMREVLATWLADAAVTKVMHSASEDLVAFRHACGTVPTPLFDTQVAAALAGLGAGVGYQRLVADQLGIPLHKGETRSNWLQRPLTAAQLDYAADDVRHLGALHARLAARLAQQDRLGWLREDCERAVAQAQAGPVERWPHLALRAAQFLDPQAQRRLLRLLRWREAQARSSDRPRAWILDNELAVALAREANLDATQLRARIDAHPKGPRKLAQAVWQAWSTPLGDEADAPLARADARDQRRLRSLQQVVRELGEELGLPEGILASRRWLEPLLEGEAWPESLGGWRRALLEPRLAPFLAPAGEAAAGSV